MSPSPSAAAGDVYLNVYTSGSGWVKIAGNPTVSNDLHVCGSTTLGGTLAVSGATTINSSLSVSGTTTIYGAVGIDGNLQVESNLLVSGTITCTGSVTIGTLIVTGNTSVSGTLHVSGASTFGDNVTIDGNLTVCGSITTNYNSATSITLTVGTATGTLTDLTTMLDSASYDITEVAGAPGLDLTVDFTSNVTSINELVVRAYYNGTSNHAVRLQLYNYNSSAWVTIHTLNDGEDYEQHYKKITDDTNFISSSTASVRLYHTEGGNPGDVLYVDYVGLTR